MARGSRLALAAALASAMAVGGTACGGDDGGGASTGGGEGKDSYKIGYVASLSGAGSVFADNGIQSAELAIDEVKAKGIVDGDIELIKVDDAGDPATSQQVCSRLVLKEKVDVIVGFQNSANRAGCLPVATRAKIPYMYATGYEGGECQPNFYVLGEVPKQQVDPLVEYMTESQGAKKWFLAGSDYVAMTEGNDYAAGVIEKLGGTVVGEEYAPLNSTDFGPVINKILGSGADTAMVSFLGTDFIAFLKQWKTTPGTDKVKLATFGLPIGGGNAVEDLYTAASYFPSVKGAVNDKYKASLEKKFGSKAQLPSMLSVVNYDAVWMWALAVQKSGGGDTDAVNTALKEVEFEGPRGTVAFNDQGHATLPMHLAAFQGDPLAGGEDLLESVPPTDPGDQCK